MTPSSICHSTSSHALILHLILCTVFPPSLIKNPTLFPLLTAQQCFISCNDTVGYRNMFQSPSLYSTVHFFELHTGVLLFRFRGQISKPLCGLWFLPAASLKPFPQFPPSYMNCYPAALHIYSLLFIFPHFCHCSSS